LTPAAIALGVTIELTPDRTMTARIASKNRCIVFPLEMRVCPDSQFQERTKEVGGYAKAPAVARGGRVHRRSGLALPLGAGRIWRGFTEIRNQQIKLRR
jgi:hypothetical protein